MGIRRLFDVLAREYDVIVAAPQSEQSGIGHAFTFNRPLHYNALPAAAGMKGFSIHGTPSDCVKFAISHLLREKPDLVISGMNIGENSGISGFYSGTVAAAREGAFWRVPSIAVSLCAGADAFLDSYCNRALHILKNLVTGGPIQSGRHVFYNVYFAACPPEVCRGIKATRQSLAFFDDRYRRVDRSDDRGDGFIVNGDKTNVETGDAFDSRALMNKFITVTPLSFDATAEWALPLLAGIEEQ